MTAHPDLPPGVTVRGDCVMVRSLDVLNRTIATAIQTGEDWRVGPLRAARDKRLNLVMVTGGSRIPSRTFKFSAPTLIDLLDDHPDAVGPSGWRQARQVLRWAGAIVVHGTGPLPEHGELATHLALATRRCALIECESRHAEAWVALVRAVAPRTPCVVLVPPPGDVHPRPGLPAGTVLQ